MHKLAYFFMESSRKISGLEDKHAVSVPRYLNHKSSSLIPIYLQSIFAFLCSLKVTGHHFSVLTLLNLELSCNSPHIISSFLKLRGDHWHGKSSFPSPEAADYTPLTLFTLTNLLLPCNVLYEVLSISTVHYFVLLLSSLYILYSTVFIKPNCLPFFFFNQNIEQQNNTKHWII